MPARELKTNTAVIVVVGPFISITDGVTLMTALTITNEKITLTAETDEGSAPTLILDNITGATAATDNDLNYIANCDNAMMQIELSAANLNRLGRMRLTITDAVHHIPVWEDFEVVSAQYYDAKYGTGNFSADAKMLSGDATAADNAESFFDGTGYAGTNNVIPTVTSAGLSAAAVDAVWDELCAGHLIVGSFGQRLAPIRTGTAQSGAAGTVTLDTGANATDDFYNNCLIVITAGTGVNQCRNITDYTGSSKIANVSRNWVTNPSSDSVFVIIPSGSVILAATQDLWAPAKAGDAMLITEGTTTGKLDVTSGVIKANLVQILAATITGTAAKLVASFTAFFNVASPVLTCASVNQGADNNTILADLHTTDIPAIKSDTAAILTDTGTTLDGNITAIKAKTDGLPTIWCSP